MEGLLSYSYASRERRRKKGIEEIRKRRNSRKVDESKMNDERNLNE